MYLVDTSVWVDYLRGRPTAQVQAVRGLLGGEDLVGIAPIILQEILQGADSPERFKKWRRYFAGLRCYTPREPVESHVEATRLYQACRRAGRTPRSSNDCLIAQISLEYALILVQDDRDFDVIAGVAPGLRLYAAR